MIDAVMPNSSTLQLNLRTKSIIFHTTRVRFTNFHLSREGGGVAVNQTHQIFFSFEGQCYEDALIVYSGNGIL